MISFYFPIKKKIKKIFKGNVTLETPAWYEDRAARACSKKDCDFFNGGNIVPLGISSNELFETVRSNTGELWYEPGAELTVTDTSTGNEARSGFCYKIVLKNWNIYLWNFHEISILKIH